MRGWARPLAGGLAAAALLALPGCQKAATTTDAAAPTAEATRQTLAAALSDATGLGTVSSALKDAGLAQMFDGAAPYTILAPRDAAFDKLGPAGAELRKPEQRAAMTAIMRDHIVPGYLTPHDINDALARSAGNGVKMKTMAGHVVTFTKVGDRIMVTQEDGSTAALVDEPLLAGNGVVLPIDAVLKKIG
ncbi:MAG: fasciclin domain-containing protein [Croceibacterium sp.]